MGNREFFDLRVLLIFIHGFRGSDKTFESFPEQLKASLNSLVPEAHINIAVYPQFETKGSLCKAVDNFCDWLKGIEDHRRRQPGENKELLTILIGHSMGGILASDAYLRYIDENQSPKQNNGVDLPFPKILGVLSFETPFYGLNKQMFSRHASTRASTVSSFASGLMSNFSKKASDTREEKKETSNGFKLAIGGLAIAAVAAGAAGAYLYKDQLSSFYSYVTGHLEFITELSKPKDLAERVKRMTEDERALFHCFYVETPIDNGASTFINPPGVNGAPSTGSHCFSAITYPSKDEIQSHIRMFNPNINTSYYAMAQKTVGLIHRALIDYVADSYY